jgi:hypothetical protein
MISFPPILRCYKQVAAGKGRVRNNTRTLSSLKRITDIRKRKAMKGISH